jgi:hypothetical protein
MADTRTRKPRSDSIRAQTAAAKAATQFEYADWPTEIVTPFTDQASRAKADVLYRDFLKTRAPQDWRQADVYTLARLAMAYVEVDLHECAVREEGHMTLGGKHNDVSIPNPRIAVLDKLYGRVKQLSSHVGLSNLPADSRLLGSNAKNHNEIESAIDRAKEGAKSLLA